ncbi:protein FAM184A-like isoform X2 [Aethina tumida]|uniref:protein FAM184A-like isoform X2 n=1 Tax=Aethina tumida TaxID=116153 RepID=UPI002147361F|nr:protein FAM184A-like isoform X2 [Aethina tumida]
MFNFFRRSKKDEKKTKEVSPKRDRKDDMCKNISVATQKPEIAPNVGGTALPNVSSEFGLRKNVANAASEVTTLTEKNDTKPANNKNCETKTMCDDGASVQHAPPTISYASMLKKTEVRDNNVRSSCVKPCGHGTTAISPRIPVIAGKRESSATPPSSPVLEIKRHFRNETPSSAPSSRKNSRDTTLENGSAASPPLKFCTPPSSPETISEHNPLENGIKEAEQKNLINQEAKYQSQLNDLSKQLAVRDAEANKLRFQMEELQRDVFAKSAGIDRLEAELHAAHKETELIRQRIRILENDIENYRKRNRDLEEDVAEKKEEISEYEAQTKAKIEELEGVIKTLREKIQSLEEELRKMSEEKQKLDERQAELLEERENEKKKLAETLEQATLQKIEVENKWKDEFEKLRTVNILKEQQLLDDFEWKLREVQQTCKKRLSEKDKLIEERLQEAYKDAEQKMKQAEDMMAQIQDMKSYETEIETLRGLTLNQEKTLKEMKDQHEQMKMTEDSLRNETKKLRNLIELEKENLQHMQRVHQQEIADKERHLQQTLNNKRIEIAMYWEERLLTECGRLKYELELIHNEEKHTAMETVRKEKDEEFAKERKLWEQKVRECFKEINGLKKALTEKEEYYQEEIVSSQTKTDRDILELRRLMDKIDMTHHEKYEKLVNEHEEELARINSEHVQKVQEVEAYWQNQLSILRASIDSIKEQMEKESQLKIENLIQQHRTELDSQWENLIHQKNEAIHLVEDEYVVKYKTLEEQFYTQQKSHSAREVELLKTIDSLKNELQSKNCTIDDLQNNVDALEGGIQVLNNEIVQQGDNLFKSGKEAESKISCTKDLSTDMSYLVLIFPCLSWILSISLFQTIAFFVISLILLYRRLL